LSSGEVDLTRAFSRWVAYRDQIWCVLAYVKKLFYHIETDNPLNADAATQYAICTLASFSTPLGVMLNVRQTRNRLMAADDSQFKQSVAACVEDSLNNVYINPTDSSLRFQEWNQQFESLRNYVLEVSPPGERHAGNPFSHVLRLAFCVHQKEDENEGIISWVSKGVSKIINIRY
jgi:hypothetical protein